MGRSLFLTELFLLSLQQHTTEPKGETFSEIPSICAYVPQVIIPGHLFPVLLCDISDIDPELIGWEDPKYSYQEHSAIYDLKCLENKEVFSVIRHWPPPSTKSD